jgi:glutamyl-tRNA synthetase
VARSTKDYIDTILESMTWLGLDWDEGPFFQSERTRLYQEHAERLLREGKAYRCYCTPEELEERRRQALAEGRKPKYDGRCRNRRDQPIDRPFAVRFKSAQRGVTTVQDLVKGTVTFNNEELDDLIIQRSDGIPTYNFVVVVDDASMHITHVIRGDDHLNNTPRQILIYEALEYPVPEFGHLPLILGQDRTRLSKRHGATSVTAYRDMGYLPHALVNYLARLGWSHGDQEIFSSEELIHHFALENVGKAAAVFNAEKLLWLNAHYIQTTPPDEIARRLAPLLARRGVAIQVDERVIKAVATLQPRAKTLEEMADASLFYFSDKFNYDEKGARKFLRPAVYSFLTALRERLESTVALRKKEMEALFRGLAETEEIKLKDAAQAVRIALTGKTVSPGLFEMMEILGSEEVTKRLERALAYIKPEREA